MGMKSVISFSAILEGRGGTPLPSLLMVTAIVTEGDGAATGPSAQRQVGISKGLRAVERPQRAAWASALTLGGSARCLVRRGTGEPAPHPTRLNWAACPHWCNAAIGRIGSFSDRTTDLGSFSIQKIRLQISAILDDTSILLEGVLHTPNLEGESSFPYPRNIRVCVHHSLFIF